MSQNRKYRTVTLTIPLTVALTREDAADLAENLIEHIVETFDTFATDSLIHDENITYTVGAKS